jgi:tRNA pseudouridine55 synthase
MPAELHGFAVVDKAAGWTSHDVVAKARGILRTRKIGHAGTLDPDATGVLVLGVGHATRLLKYCTAFGKSYAGEIVFGVETTTLDAAGEVTATHDMRALTPHVVRAATQRFVGDIEQIPPMVSAVKVGGKRLHELARQGIEVERAPRPVHVARFEVDALAPDPDGHPVYRCEVDCSSGTYIRTLAADLGTALGGGAHLRALRRTAVGPFTLAEAVPLDALGPEQVVTPAFGMRSFGLREVDDATAALVANGRVLPLDVLGVEGDGPWPVCDHRGALIAVYERHRGSSAKPSVVLPATPAPVGHGADPQGS